MKKIRTRKQIQAEIRSLKETFELAAANLRNTLNEKKPHYPYYLERLMAQLNLCTEIAGRRAQLEYEFTALCQQGK